MWSAEVTQSARSLQPGEVLLLEVRTRQAVKSVSAVVFERSFALFPEDEGRHWRGLIGIDLDVEPGDHPLQVKAVGADGRDRSLQHLLIVQGKTFPTRYLEVDDRYVNPPAEVVERIRRESQRVSRIFEATTPHRLWDGPFHRPVPGAATSSFGKRSVLNGKPRSPHSGTDFRAEAGAPVQAPNAGRVVLAADLYYSGNTVIIDHGWGLYSYFAHLSKVSVQEGDHVAVGDGIGLVGATGRVTGPHLHWSVRLVGARVDPLSLVAVLAESGH